MPTTNDVPIVGQATKNLHNIIMFYAKQRKLDNFFKTAETKSSNKSDGGSEADVLTTPTETESTSSSNISKESNAEIGDDYTTFANSSAGRHSFVTSLPQKSLIAVKSNTSFEDNSVRQDKVEKENELLVRYACQILKL